MPIHFHVLVVEDDYPQVRFLEYGLQNQPDIEATIVPTVEDAREALRNFSFDFIFLDGNLSPLTKGSPQPDTLELLKSVSGEYGLRIFTTTDNLDYREQMLKNGCAQHIEKDAVAPFLLNLLEVRNLVPHSHEGSYSLHQGNLLVIRLKHPEMDQGSPYLAYIAEVAKENPLVLKVAETGPYSELNHGDYLILAAESQMIQGDDEAKQELLRHYLKMQPLRSGLACFGGAMGKILPGSLQPA